MNIFNTRLRANYELTGKIFLQGEFDSPSTSIPNNISNYTVSGGLYLYYNWLPKLSVGIGGTFGYTWVDDPTTEPNFRAGELAPQLSGDSQIRLVCFGEALSSASSTATAIRTPHRCLKSGSRYHPFEGTTISLGGRAADLQFRVTLLTKILRTTYVVGRFQQRLFRRFYFGLGAGYENSNYFATDRQVNATRNDDYWFIEPSLDVLITRWLSAGVYYLHREDSSNDRFLQLDDNQVGVRATVRF